MSGFLSEGKLVTQALLQSDITAGHCRGIQAVPLVGAAADSHTPAKPEEPCHQRSLQNRAQGSSHSPTHLFPITTITGMFLTTCCRTVTATYCLYPLSN